MFSSLYRPYHFNYFYYIYNYNDANYLENIMISRLEGRAWLDPLTVADSCLSLFVLGGVVVEEGVGLLAAGHLLGV